jgi:hypothetical protein
MQPMRSHIMVYKPSDKGSINFLKATWNQTEGRFHQIEKIVEMEIRSCFLLKFMVTSSEWGVSEVSTPLKVQLRGAYFWNSLALKVLPSVKIDKIFYKKIPYMYHRKINSKKVENFENWTCLKNFIFQNAPARFYHYESVPTNTL